MVRNPDTKPTVTALHNNPDTLTYKSNAHAKRTSTAAVSASHTTLSGA